MRFETPSETEHTPVDVEESNDAVPWWRQYAAVILIGLIFVPACIIYTWIYFPELGPVKSIFTGLFFGLFCTMCAASGRVFW